MNCLNIGLGFLLILFNLFIYANSYAMTSEICDHHTIFGHEMLADLFDRIDFGQCSFSWIKQVRKRNKDRKKSSEASESKHNCYITLIKKFFPDRTRPLLEQEAYVETLATLLPHSSSNCIESLDTEK